MIIYKATNKINGKIYIGQTIKTLQKRINGHISNGNRYNYKFANAIKKYGADGFEWEIIEECKTIKQLNEREEYWIKELNSMDSRIGYNVKYGGNNHILTEETKRKIGDAKRGCNNHMFSKKTPLETKIKIANANRGRKHTDETKTKISNAKKGKLTGENHPLFGKHRTYETKRKISKATTGKKIGERNPMYGRRHPVELQKIINEKNTIKLDINKIIELYKEHKSVEKVGKIMGINRGTVWNRLSQLENWEELKS